MKLKKYPALDLNAVWSVLSSVKQSGSNKVVFDFSKSAVPYFYYVADQVPIVPEHIWSKIKNPVTDPIAKPVGTGGYELASCTPQNIKWTANPNYWQKGLPVVKTLNMPAFLSNEVPPLAVGLARRALEIVGAHEGAGERTARLVLGI